MKIKTIDAYQIIDSRGNPTVAATVTLENGASGWAAVPSGASTGTYEAVELRDGTSDYGGLGVSLAIRNIKEKIAPVLIGQIATEQEAIDQLMIDLDGTPNKANLGANAILPVSLAVARAAAAGLHQPLYKYLTKFNPRFNGTYKLPLPMLNILNGGKHADWATDIQEYMILPVGARNMQEVIKMGTEIYQALKKTLKSKGYPVTVGDEGGFAPAVKTNAEAFDLLSEAVQNAGYQLGKEVLFGIDAAATEFFRDGKYQLKKEGKELSANELVKFYQSLANQYPLFSFEDVLAEDDWAGWQEFMTVFNDKIQVVGDDLYVTNVERLKEGINTGASNSILIKLNQIGTLTETITAINLALEHNFTTVLSHRSGETEDAFIADLAVALGTGQIKTGAPARSERTSKYNRLLAIAAELGEAGELAPFPFLP